MSTKAKPGAFDCYARAEADEEMFILLARDEAAPWLVRIWSAIKSGHFATAEQFLRDLIAIAKDWEPERMHKVFEALACSDRMIAGKRERDRMGQPYGGVKPGSSVRSAASDPSRKSGSTDTPSAGGAGR